MFPTIRVRQATPADVPQMIAIAARAVTAAHWGPKQYEEMFSTGRFALVIEEDDEVVGFIVGRGVKNEWEIENIAIKGAARRRGLGSRLLGEFLHQIRDNGATQVFLEVRESNHAARRLYEKWAFVEGRRRKDYYLDPVEDALVLKFYFPQTC